MIFKDTEQDIVITPTPYWQLFLQPRLEELLQKKILPPRSVRADDTNVVVSVKGRAERPLTKRFDELNIDWPVVEKKRLAWSELFRKGKQLRMDI